MRAWVVSGGAGILAGLGILFPALWFVSCIGVALFAYALRAPASRRATFLVGSWFGSFFCGTAIAWFWAALPFDWIGIDGTIASVGLMIASWSYIALGLGLFFGAFATVYARYRTDSGWDALFAASLWTLVQYGQMWGFAILTIGGSSLLGAHFSPPLLGYALAGFSPLLQIASLGGIYALTFTAALIGFLAHHFLPRIRGSQRRIAIISGMLFCVSVLTYVDTRRPLAGVVPARSGETTVRVALLSTYEFGLDASVMVSRKSRELYSTLDQLARPVDIVVAPEGADILASDAQPPSLVIDSAFMVENGVKRSRLRFRDARGLIGEYEKMFLVPQGEYVVWATVPAIRLFLGSRAGAYIKNFDLARGERVTRIEAAPGRIGALFCSDVLSPSLYRTLTKEGAQVLINSASQAPFHGSSLTDTLVISMAKVRAVENGRYLALSGNAIPSFLVSDRGILVAQSPKGESTILTADAQLRSYLTPYVRLGGWVLLVPLVFCMLFMWREERRRITPRGM